VVKKPVGLGKIPIGYFFLDTLEQVLLPISLLMRFLSIWLCP